MSMLLPKDEDSRSTGSRAKAIVHYLFDSDHWEYRDITGVDVGVDCVLELTENDLWTGNSLECQVKGRTTPKYNCSKEFISIEMKVSTINYALSKANTFMLLLVDIMEERTYYLPIQDYFINNPSYFDKLTGNQESITLRVPTLNVLQEDDSELQSFAKNQYIGGPGLNLHKAL